MKEDVLQMSKNISSPTQEELGECLPFFRRKYLNPQSMATANHELQKLVFNPADQKLVDFHQEL